MGEKDWISRLKQYLVSYQYLTGTIVALLTTGMWLIGIWQPLEQVGYSFLFQIRNRVITSGNHWDPRVVMIAIDETSLKTYGRFPSWNRDRYQQLLQVLSINPPAAIGFDILFSEPSPEDQQLAEEIQWSGNVVLAVGIDAQKQPIEVVPELAKVAHLGQIVARSDSDGIIRKSSLYIGNFPAFSVALLQIYNQTISEILTAEQTDTIESQISLPKPVSRGKELQVWINWPAPVTELTTYSFADVVQGKINPSAFANKIVLVGTTATGLDPLITPFNQVPPASGVYLHAAIVDNLLNRRLLQRLPLSSTLLLLIWLSFLTPWLLKPRNWQWRLITLLLLLMAWCAIALLGFSFFHWWLPVFAPIGTILLAATGVQVQEQYEKQQLMSLFSQHVSPEMAQVIWQKKGEILAEGQIEPQELTATVLFIDIRGYTSISENLSPRELLNWLNLYLDTMSRCLMEHGGVIDKYIGDAIMAVFGIPVAKTKAEEIQQDVLNAIAASLAMHKRMEQLNQRLKAEGKPLIKVGIGIHTGLVVVGSLGGNKRLNYSVVGDTVNVAARLEGMNKDIMGERPYQILVSDSTFAYVQHQYLAQEVGMFQLRGKASATKVYSIVGKK